MHSVSSEGVLGGTQAFFCFVIFCCLSTARTHNCKLVNERKETYERCKKEKEYNVMTVNKIKLTSCSHSSFSLRIFFWLKPLKKILLRRF